MRHNIKVSIAASLALALALLSFTPGCGDDKPEPGSATRGEAVAKTKCTFCHYIDGKGGMIAPPMEQSIAQASQQVRGYEKRVEDLKARYAKEYAKEQVKIDAILAQQDPAKRYEMWLGAYLTDTKFDNPMTKMGNVIMTAQQRADVIAWLMTRRPTQ
jgi:cytochrome c2